MSPEEPIPSRKPVTGASERARIGGLTVARAPAETIETAKADLATVVLAEHIRRTVEAAPAISPEQRMRLAAILLAEPTAATA